MLNRHRRSANRGTTLRFRTGELRDSAPPGYAVMLSSPEDALVVDPVAPLVVDVLLEALSPPPW
jgi:hypothetical protein